MEAQVVIELAGGIAEAIHRGEQHRSDPIFVGVARPQLLIDNLRQAPKEASADQILNQL